MVETNLTIIVNKKSDIELVKQILKQNKFYYPIYIFEYEFHYEIRFNSDSEEWELNTAIEESLPDYNFVTELYGGSREIRMQISRYKDPMSVDGWGSPVETSINQTWYLVKQDEDKQEKYNPAVEVLFLGESRQYFIHIINGINKANDERGYLILKDFNNRERQKNGDFFADTLYPGEIQAFQHGYYKLQAQVQEDYEKLIETKSKAIRAERKLPRKLVRGFINSCNKANIDNVLKSLDSNFIFERQEDWNCELKLEGISNMEKYLRSGLHDLFSNNFKIRSSWDFKSNNVYIGVKYYTSKDVDGTDVSSLTYSYFSFTLEGNKLLKIVKSNRLITY